MYRLLLYGKPKPTHESNYTLETFSEMNKVEKLPEVTFPLNDKPQNITNGKILKYKLK